MKNQLKTTVIFLIFCLATVDAVVKEFTETNDRGVSSYWSTCDQCTCKYFDVYAYEYSTSNSQTGDSSFHYFYSSYVSYDSCNWTWTGGSVYLNTPVAGLSISNSARNAKLNISGLTDSSGNSISINLNWNDVGIKSNCNCRYDNYLGPFTYKQVSNSKYTQTGVTGSMTVNGVAYAADGSYGYIYDYGTKSISIEHP